MLTGPFLQTFAAAELDVGTFSAGNKSEMHVCHTIVTTICPVRFLEDAGIRLLYEDHRAHRNGAGNNVKVGPEY